MDFKQRLQQAAQRGEQTRDARDAEAAAKALSEEEWKRMHSGLRLELNDHIESCLKQLADNFPGFHYEPVVNDRGWGGMVQRDDLQLNNGKRENLFSRLTLTISPHNKYHVLELVAKGAIRNKENYTRNHYRELKEVDLEQFRQLVEQFTLEYAEEYSAA